MSSWESCTQPVGMKDGSSTHLHVILLALHAAAVGNRAHVDFSQNPLTMVQYCVLQLLTSLPVHGSRMHDPNGVAMQSRSELQSVVLRYWHWAVAHGGTAVALQEHVPVHKDACRIETHGCGAQRDVVETMRHNGSAIHPTDV